MLIQCIRNIRDGNPIVTIVMIIFIIRIIVMIIIVEKTADCLRNNELVTSVTSINHVSLVNQ